MTRKLSAAAAKNSFSESLRLAESGEVVEITRYGKPVAALVGLKELEQLRRLRAVGPEAGLSGLVDRFPGGGDFCEAIDEVVRERSGPRSLPDLDL